MKSKLLKLGAAIGLLSASAIAFAASNCCGELAACCLELLGCC